MNDVNNDVIKRKFTNLNIIMLAISILIPLAAIFAFIKLYSERRKYKNNPQYKFMLNLPIARIAFLIALLIGLFQAVLIAAIILPNIMRF